MTNNQNESPQNPARSENENINYGYNSATNPVKNYLTSESNGDVNSVPIRVTYHGHYPCQLQTNSNQFISRTQNIGDVKEKKICTTPSHITYVPIGQTHQHLIAGNQIPVGSINTPAVNSGSLSIMLLIKLLLVSIYMPCKGAPNNINDFQECVDILFEIVQTFGTSHTIIFGGDFNENLLTISNSARSKYILDFMRECNFLTDNVSKTFRLSNGKDSTAIDYILYSEQFHDAVLHIRKLEVIGNVSDHYPVVASFSFEFVKILKP
jgi:hypothetical protein